MPHPYSEYEHTRAWTIVSAAVQDLVDNQDIVEQTPREYIVGYLIGKLTEGELLVDCQEGARE